MPILVLSCRNEHSGLFLWLRQQTISLEVMNYLEKIIIVNILNNVTKSQESKYGVDTQQPSTFSHFKTPTF